MWNNFIGAQPFLRTHLIKYPGFVLSFSRRTEHMEGRWYWLARLLHCSGTVQFYLPIVISSRTPFILHSVSCEYCTLRHNLANLAWQVYLYSLQSILFALITVYNMGRRTLQEANIFSRIFPLLLLYKVSQ